MSYAKGFGRGRRPALIAGCCAIALLLAAAPARAQQSDFGVRFSPSTPGTATTFDLHIVYRREADPAGKPSPIRHLVIQLPSGTRINTAGLPRCTASDQQIQAQGTAACPADSRVGSGTLTAITGFGPPVDPYATRVTIFNDGDGWVEIVQDERTGATLATDRLAANGSTLTGNPPSVPGGPPDGQTAVRQIDFTFPASSRYVETPAICPSGRTWTSAAAFTFADGSTQHIQSSTACSPKQGGGRRPAPHLRLIALPRRVQTGWRRIRFIVRSPSPSCREHAAIRFAHRVIHTGAHGRAVLHVWLKRARSYRAVVTTAGCGRAATKVIARRAAGRPDFDA